MSFGDEVTKKKLAEIFSQDDFEAPEVEVEYWKDEILVRVNTAQWLEERLEYDPALDQCYQEWVDWKHPHDTRLYYSRADYYAQAEAWVKWLAQRTTMEARGIYYEGEPFWLNTYNHENHLDRNITFYYFELEDSISSMRWKGQDIDLSGPFVILEGVAFRCDTNRSELGIFDYAQITMAANDCANYRERMLWDSEDAGWSWHRSEGPKDVPDFTGSSHKGRNDGEVRNGEYLDIHVDMPRYTNGQLDLPGVPGTARETLVIEDVHPSQQKTLREAYEGIFKAYWPLFSPVGFEVQASLYDHEAEEYIEDPDRVIFHDEKRGWFRDFELNFWPW